MSISRMSENALIIEGRLLDRHGNSTPRAKFFEQRMDWIYHLFTHFWSRHGLLSECNCKPDQCSRVLVVDGHQKARRIVCAYEGVMSLVNQDELGPCRRGCPYAPTRRKLQQVDKQGSYRTFAPTFSSIIVGQQNFSFSMSFLFSCAILSTSLPDESSVSSKRKCGHE
jgi:hypothetical protein